MPKRVDVVVETEIDRAPERVAAYMFDPDNAPEWYENIQSVEWRTPRPLSLGSRLAFVARFLGRRLAYTYEIVELDPPRRLVMRTAEGPFPMETSYSIEAVRHDRAHITLRNRGEATGFTRLVAPTLARSMQKANRNDLERLKQLLESRP